MIGTLIQFQQESELATTGMELKNMTSPTAEIEVDHEMVEVRSTQKATVNVNKEELVISTTELAKEEEEENEWLNKGNLSTAVALLIMVAGIILRVSLPAGTFGSPGAISYPLHA